MKRYLEKETDIDIDGLPRKFMETLVSHGLRVDLIEPGRLLCSFTVPTRLLVRFVLLYLSLFFLGFII